MPGLHVELGCDPAEVPRLLEAVKALVAPLAPAPRALHHTLVAIEEITRNAILHGGLAPPAPGPAVTVTLDGDALTCRIVDCGVPFDPFTDTPLLDTASPVAERPVGGLGVHLVRRLVDAWSYEWQDGRNCTVLRKRLK